MRSKSQQIISYYLGLHTQNSSLRDVDLEPSPKRASYKKNKLIPRRMNLTGNQSPEFREVELELSVK